MLSLRGFERLKPSLTPLLNTGFRRLTVNSSEPHRTDDVLVEMENPFKEPQKGCVLCGVTVDYRNVQLLSQFISPHTGRIYGRHITGLCGIKQKEISKAVKKAHAMGFMSVTHKHPQFIKDPNICSIKQLD